MPAPLAPAEAWRNADQVAHADADIAASCIRQVTIENDLPDLCNLVTGLRKLVILGKHPVVGSLRFDLGNDLQSGGMPAAFETRIQPGLDDHLGQLQANHS